MERAEHVTDQSFSAAARGDRPALDLDWYAVDAKGHVAYLTSAGFGAIPAFVFRDKAAYVAAIEGCRLLPVRGSYALMGSRAGRFDSWIEAARRGHTIGTRRLVNLSPASHTR